MFAILSIYNVFYYPLIIAIWSVIWEKNMHVCLPYPADVTNDSLLSLQIEGNQAL